MKAKRTPLSVTDFSGGINTDPPQTDVDSKYSPDCLNVYAEGKALRKRFGFTKINSSSAGTIGNGIYNWVLSASQQYLIGLFDNVLKQMSVSGNSWSGTWATLSADSATGTPFSSGIMGFVTYQGTLIMTTENQDKPQRITATDTSYKNIDFGGTGVAPFAKYSQIWKEHVWLLNIKAGGQLSEDCISLASWTTLDVSTGITATTSLGGLATFRYHAGAGAGSDAHIKRTVASMSSSYSAEIKTFFTSVSNVTGGDYAYMDICNGLIRFRTRWSQDGLETFNGTTWNQIGVGLVSTGVWITWKFLVTANTAASAAVSVLQNGAPVGIQFSAANVSAASSGQIDIACNAGASSSRGDWYMDYLYINPIIPKIDYITNGGYETAFVGGLPPNWNIYPTQPYLHYKCNDNAANSTVTDAGTGGNNGTSNNDSGAINTSVISVAGKISSAFSLTRASKQYVKMASATMAAVSADLIGSICFWFKSDTISETGHVFAAWKNGGLANLNIFCNGNGGAIAPGITVDNSVGTTILNYKGSTVFSNNTWYHVAVVQNGTVSIYVNGSLETITKIVDTTPTAWMISVPSCDTGAIGNINFNAYSQVVVDDFRYFRTAITSTEIASIYAEGNGTETLPVITQNTNTAFIKQGTASLQIAVGASGYAIQTQTLSSGTAIAGVASYIGSWFYATNSQTYKINVNDGANNYTSPVLTGNGTWQYQTLSFTPGSDSSAVMVQFLTTSSGTMYVDQTSLITSAVGITQDYSDRLQRSVSGTYDTWTGGDSGSNDITTPQDVGLTGSFILQDRMYITKAWNIYRITYTGSVPLLDIKQARSVVGTKSSRAIKNIDLPGVGEVVIFLGTDRNLYLFDGFASTNLSDVIQLNNNMASVYMNNINTQALDKVFAVNHSNLGWYEIFLPIGNSTVPNFSLAYNYRTKAFWPFDNRNFLSGNVSDDGSGERVIIVAGASDGNIYEINSDKGTSDAGAAINAYWNSFKLGQDYILAKQDELRIATDATSATPYIKWRTNYETSYTSKTLGANTNSYVFDPARDSNLFQFQIGDNSTGAIWKFWHVKALERGIGIGE